MENKMKNILSPAYYLRLKNIILLLNWGLIFFFFFFQIFIFTTLFQCCPTLWKSKLKMTTLFQRCLTLFKSTLKCTTLIRRCSTLTYTALFQCWFDVETTLKPRLNVCWDIILVSPINLQACQITLLDSIRGVLRTQSNFDDEVLSRK